ERVALPIQWSRQESSRARLACHVAEAQADQHLAVHPVGLSLDLGLKEGIRHLAPIADMTTTMGWMHTTRAGGPAGTGDGLWRAQCLTRAGKRRTTNIGSLHCRRDHIRAS